MKNLTGDRPYTNRGEDTKSDLEIDGSLNDKTEIELCKCKKNAIMPYNGRLRPVSGSSTFEGGEPALSKSEKFKMQDADWEAAARHGLANKVVRVTKTKLNMEDEESYCPCCMQPVPTEDERFPVCVDNLELGDMGAPGFPLFFEFQKQVGYIFVVLTLIYFLPM